VKALVGDKITYGTDAYGILDDADALLIVTEWSAFRTPDFEQITERLKNKVIFDGRNLYDLQKMVDLGFYYNSIGRKIIS
ncbi:UDP-glucose/GDP-mannose dehydrogenase family protein, partial [Mucilaginibacter sp. 5B2]|nr:UDP-glucose/GDP-mannose dehydrogenase family protein [Mucilaginibacter sp. 5B2]